MSAIHWSQSKVDEQYPLYEPIVAWQTVKFNPSRITHCHQLPQSRHRERILLVVWQFPCLI